MTTKTPVASPTQIYLAGLSEGSQQGMRQSLEIIVGILNDDHDAETFPWQQVTYADSMAVRIALTERYKAATVNKMLSALRGVLKQTWRLGLMDADAYRRAADVENVRASRLLSGRALAGEEIAKLFATCTADASPKGARDAALLAVLYGCGLRRGELAGLDVEDFDADDCSIMVHGKRNKQRTVYLSGNGCRHVQAWLEHSGDAPGPLFCPVDQTGEIRISRLRGESVAYIVKRLQQAAGVEHFSPHDVRRTTITDLLDANVDVLTVQKVAGHADVTTTARYDRRDETAKRRAVQSLDLPTPA